MNDFIISSVTDDEGRKGWLLYEPGKIHHPVALIRDSNMRFMARCVIQEPAAPIPPENIGQSILLYRKAHKLTQKEMAERIGISRNYLSQIERGGSRNLSFSVHQRIIDCLTQ